MHESAQMEILSGYPVLVVVFGGIRQGVGIDTPPFEFLRSLSRHKCDAVFLRDFRQAWYQSGIESVDGGVAGLAQWLRARRIDYARAITLGNSMGGFAALLLGRLAGFDLSIAFSPQTTIESLALATLGDRRWQAHVERIYDQVADGCYFDVLSVPAADPVARHYSFLFFGAESPLDAAHAMRLAGTADAYLFAVRGSSHDAVRLLRDSGSLDDLMRMACDPSVSPADLVDHLCADQRLTMAAAPC